MDFSDITPLRVNTSEPVLDSSEVTIDYDEALPHDSLSNMSDDELVDLYNEKAENGSPAAMQKAQVILSELQRRDSAERERRMAELNDQVRGLTWAIFALTLVNAMAAAYQAVGG